MSTPRSSAPGSLSLHTVILAAGLGRRLWPLTRDWPKPLLDLGQGRTILGRQLEVLSAAPEVGDITVVAGHLAHRIESFVDASSTGADVRFNPFYDLAGPLGSIWAVRDIVGSVDCLIANGDTVFDPALVGEIAERSSAGGIVLVGSRCESFAPDDVGIEDSDGMVVRVGKGVVGGTARSSGLLAITGDTARRAAMACLDEVVRHPDLLAGPWHGWVDLMARRVGVELVLVDEEHWSEVDLHPELEDLRTELASRLR